MTLRQRRPSQSKNPRGILLAFIAAAIQAVLPFLIATDIALAANPVLAGDISICSSQNSSAQHANGASGDRHRSNAPSCAAVAAAQSFTAPPLLSLPLPVSCGRIVPATVVSPRLSFDAAAPYRSRAPPSQA